MTVGVYDTAMGGAAPDEFKEGVEVPGVVLSAKEAQEARDVAQLASLGYKQECAPGRLDPSHGC